MCISLISNSLLDTQTTVRDHKTMYQDDVGSEGDYSILIPTSCVNGYCKNYFINVRSFLCNFYFQK